VLAAAFCPRAFGRECCFAKTAHHTHSSSSSHENMPVHHMHMDGMSMDNMDMDGMNMGDMPMDAVSMDHMGMGINDTEINAVTVDLSIRFLRPLLPSKLKRTSWTSQLSHVRTVWAIQGLSTRLFHS